jgi:glycine oxidase
VRVLLVGAGIIGLSVAEELARRGVEVQLFEKGDRPGCEASSAAAGILSPQGEADGPGPFLDLLLAGYQMIPEAVARLTALTQMDLKYRASGMISVALSEQDEQELNRQVAWQQRAGLRLERLTAARIKEMEPAIDGPVRSGVWWPQTAQIDNTRLVEATAEVVRTQGGTIHLKTPVTRFLMDRNRVVGVQTPQGEVTADWVVNSSGSWAGFDGALSVAIPAIPVKGQILQYRTDVPIVQRIIKSPRAYLVQRSDRQLIVGTTVEHAGYDKRVTDLGRRQIQTGVREMTSRLDSLTLESSWAGLRPGTPDRLPILGPTPWDRLLLATGHYRNGILLAPLTGRLIADWITRGGCSIDLSPFGLTRFMVS